MEAYSGGVLARRPLVYVELLMEAGPIESLVESLMKAYSTTGQPIKACPKSPLWHSSLRLTPYVNAGLPAPLLAELET